jgi:DNA-binding transcriptional MerR regulator
MKAEFTIKDIVKIFSVPRERFKSWVSFGFLEPSVQRASGKGSYNIYNAWDLYMTGLFVHLSKLGLNHATAAEITKLVKNIRADRQETIKYIAFRHDEETLDSGNIAIKNIVALDEMRITVDLKTSETIRIDSAKDIKLLGAADRPWTDIVLINLDVIKSHIDKEVLSLG